MAEYLLALKYRQEVAKDTMAFWFDTLGSGYIFRAGQNAHFTLIDPPETDGGGNARTLSFASAPNDKGSLMVAMRMRSSAFKNSLQTLPLGTRVKVSRPMGSFTLHKDASRPAVFLAGGIGITPIRSIVGWATDERLPHKLHLFYSNRTAEETAFMERFESLTRENPNLKFIPTVTASRNGSWRGETGRIDKNMLVKYVPEIRDPIYYVAGPSGMVAAMRQLLDGLGVNEDNIKTEEFAGY
jgi:ferredoxin-NADP reductase